MPRLQQLRPSVGRLAPRLGYAEGDQSGKEAYRRQIHPWRKWYQSGRWRKLRLEIFARDAYVCQATGALLNQKEPQPFSPVCDHIVPHRGDHRLFWDPNNLRTVSKKWHDSVKQAEERALPAF